MQSTDQLRPGRVAVFVDYQNVYRIARDAFGFGYDAHYRGQVHPQRLGLKLAGVADDRRTLACVRMYRGSPSPTKDGKGAGAFDRQVHSWFQQPMTRVCTRPLNYRTDPPREKGIDVKIAVDIVVGAVRNEFDVCVLFSADTDLLPALEYVAEVKGLDAVEVAAWLPPNAPANRLTLGGGNIWCHLLDERDYKHVADETDYTGRRRRR